ncbi:MAG TPA: ABC transporter ATP-binding protein [Limnochordales bacterium]
MQHLQLIKLTKRFGAVTAVDGVSLDIAQGEFVTLLGPSGCGKTTILRMIAGLETPDDGRIVVSGNDITFTPANRRGFGMVFQNYALFPHLTVMENVAFGLRARGESQATVEREVKRALELVRLAGFEHRKPSQLSGGQQQRVALARALAARPEILLLDEPLSNLDAQLREETRAEILRLQKDFGITAIYVTHDQAEAFALSDRIAVMNRGRVEQIGTPAEIYSRPANAFVARFLGSVNVLAGSVAGVEEGRALVDVGFARLWSVLDPAKPVQPGQAVQVCIHPENVEVTDGHGPNAVAVEVDIVQFHGVTTNVRFQAGDQYLHAVVLSRSSAAGLRRGERVYVGVRPENVLLLPANS